MNKLRGLLSYERHRSRVDYYSKFNYLTSYSLSSKSKYGIQTEPYLFLHACNNIMLLNGMTYSEFVNNTHCIEYNLPSDTSTHWPWCKRATTVEALLQFLQKNVHDISVFYDNHLIQITARHSTFGDRLDPQMAFSECGFVSLQTRQYLFNKTRTIQCFACKVIIKGKYFTEPVIEHYYHNPNCMYINLIYNFDVSENNGTLILKDTPFQKNTNILCSVCKLYTISVLHLECNHATMCGKCFYENKYCLVCNIEPSEIMIIRVINNNGQIMAINIPCKHAVDSIDQVKSVCGICNQTVFGYFKAIITQIEYY